MSNTGTYRVDPDSGALIKISDRANALPDVFCKGGSSFEANLGDDAHPWGQWVSGKRHKAQIMKQQGVFESGDRVHGAR